MPAGGVGRDGCGSAGIEGIERLDQAVGGVCLVGARLDQQVHGSTLGEWRRHRCMAHDQLQAGIREELKRKDRCDLAAKASSRGNGRACIREADYAHGPVSQ